MEGEGEGAEGDNKHKRAKSGRTGTKRKEGGTKAETRDAAMMHTPFVRFLLEERLQLLDAVMKAVVLLLHRGKVLFPCFYFP